MKIEAIVNSPEFLAASTDFERGIITGLKMAAALPLDIPEEHESENGSAAHLRTKIMAYARHPRASHIFFHDDGTATWDRGTPRQL